MVRHDFYEYFRESRVDALEIENSHGWLPLKME